MVNRKKLETDIVNEIENNPNASKEELKQAVDKVIDGEEEETVTESAPENPPVTETPGPVIDPVQNGVELRASTADEINALQGGATAAEGMPAQAAQVSPLTNNPAGNIGELIRLYTEVTVNMDHLFQQLAALKGRLDLLSQTQFDNRF